MGKKAQKTPHHFLVNGNKYTVIKKLGEGGFSTIYKVKFKGHTYALKRIGANDDKEANKFLQEAIIMKKYINNRFILKCIEYCSRRNENDIIDIYIVMEYCERNLNAVIAEYIKNNAININQILVIFNQICMAVAEFHYSNPPLIHRDIKTENVLQKDAQHYLLCDFGSVTDKIYDPHKTSFNKINDDIQINTTLAYRSPEMISQLQGCIISTKSDIWALGCLLYKMLYGDTPFGESQPKILDGMFEFPDNPLYSDSIKELINYMLINNPDDRPTIYDVHIKICSILNTTPKLEPMPDHSIIKKSSPKNINHITNFPSLMINSSMYVSEESIRSKCEDDSKVNYRFSNPFLHSNDLNFTECRQMMNQIAFNTGSHSDIRINNQKSYNCDANNYQLSDRFIDPSIFPNSQHDGYNISINNTSNLMKKKSHYRHKSLNDQIFNSKFQFTTNPNDKIHESSCTPFTTNNSQIYNNDSFASNNMSHNNFNNNVNSSTFNPFMEHNHKRNSMFGNQLTTTSPTINQSTHNNNTDTNCSLYNPFPPNNHNNTNTVSTTVTATNQSFIHYNSQSNYLTTTSVKPQTTTVSSSGGKDKGRFSYPNPFLHTQSSSSLNLDDGSCGR